jgi:hypothetical protein
MTASRRADLLGTIVLFAVVAFHVVVLAAWFRFDTQPPRWDESHLLMLSEYSYEQLRLGHPLRALRIDQLTNAKTGMLPFLSAVSYFIVGDDERVAAFLENAASLVLLGLAMGSLSLRLFGDALPAAAGLALMMSSFLFATFTHGYYVEMPLVALVTLTVAAAVEIRAREFTRSKWNWVLGLALVIGIPMKHLYLPFVAVPLLFIALHYLVGGAGTRAERLHRLLRVGAIALVATLVGLSYHILNWRVVAELLLRAGDAARTGGIGSPPTLTMLFRDMGQDVFREHLILGVLVLLVAAGALLLRARFALALLTIWIVNVTVVVAIAASYPLIYYFLPFYPAFAMLATGWLARPLMPQALRLLSAGVLLAAVGVGTAAASFVHLGTYNPLAVVAETPLLLRGKDPIRNPFVSYDSTAPRLVEAHHDARPYAHDWRMDEFVAAIGKVVAQGPVDRSYTVALMSDMERMAQSLIGFKLWQHRLVGRVASVGKFGQTSFADVDFLIFKTGDIFSYQAANANPVLAGYQAQVEKLLADDGAALKQQGFSVLLAAPLPDGSTGTLWINRRLAAK